MEGFSEVLAKETAPLGIKVTIAEPGAFRTDWAGSSMTIAEIREEYQPTVGAFVELRRTHNGTQRGDAAKAAQVILQVAEMEEPPLRLLLGSDAVYVAGVVAAQRAAEDERWKALSVSRDFEDTPGVEESMGRLVMGLRR